MKNFLFTILTIFICGIAVALPEGDGDKKSNPGETGAKVKTVLVIGLKEGNITSNYFMAENIAEKTALSKDSLEEAFSMEIIQGIKKIHGSGFNFVHLAHDKNSNVFLDKVQYRYDKEMMVSDLSDLKDEDYQKLIKQHNAEYVLFLDHYFLKYEGGSNLFHIYNYDVYNKNKKNIYSGKTFFNTPDLEPLANYQKKYEKSGNKIIDQLQKLSE
ncbi:MAG: hypothetical protein HC830_09620 [Bacteroidetes bacterium]|nr:hypothetical protein [Bacteroidota bacterium]